MQMFVDIGPIPRGQYTMQQPRDIESRGLVYAIPLHPWPENRMFGREGFYMHSERIMGPHGEAGINSIVIATQARMAIWKSGDRELVVVE
jgi:hypothetical protein